MSTLALRLWEQGRMLGGRQAGITEKWSRKDAAHPEEDSTGSQETSEGCEEQEQREPMAKRPISRPPAPCSLAERSRGSRVVLVSQV